MDPPRQPHPSGAHNNTPWAVFRPTLATPHARPGVRPPAGVFPGAGVSNFRPIAVPGPGQRPAAPAAAQGSAGPSIGPAPGVWGYQAHYRPMAALPPQVTAEPHVDFPVSGASLA